MKKEKAKRIAKRITALAAAVAMASTFTFPAEIGDGYFSFGNAIVASAAEIYDGSALDISNGSIVINSDNTITQGSTIYTYSDGQTIIVTGTSATNYISVNSGKITDITLQNASVGGSLASNVAAFSISDGSTANITLVGSNTLTGGYNAPGVFVAKDNTVSFTAASTGSLTASGNNQAPGIGASATAEGGHIIVNGGDITVKAGGYTATNALGSAFAVCNKPAQSFTMTGGRVCAVPTKGFDGGFFGDNVSTTAVTVSGDIIISGGIFISQFENLQSHGTGIGGKLITTDSGNAVIWTKFGCYMGSAISDTSNKAEWHGIIIEGYTDAKVYGSNVTLPGDFTIETDVDEFGDDVVLEVPEGSALVIPSGVTLTNNNIIKNYGTIIIDGTLTNSGTINNFGSIVNNNAVTGTGKIYNENGGTTTGNGTYATAPVTIGTDFRITPDTLVYGRDYTYEDGVLKIMSTTAMTIANANTGATTDRIEVADGISANITLAGVNINTYSLDKCAFLIADGSAGTVTITLSNGTTNILTSAENLAGLQKNGENGELIIQGEGVLIAKGGNGSAGIGASIYSKCVNITIKGGIITAYKGSGAAIGSGYRGGNAANVKITGGSVKTIDSYGSLTDMGNDLAPVDVTDGAENLYRLVIENPNSRTVSINGNNYTPVNHKAADSNDGNLYAYLPARTIDNPLEVKVGTETIKYIYDTTNSRWLAIVDKPAEDNRPFTYDGTEQTYNITESDYYTISGNKQKNAGTYTITVSLKDTTKTVWNDGTTSDKTYTFTIGKATAPQISEANKSYHWGLEKADNSTPDLPLDTGTTGTVTFAITDTNNILKEDSVFYMQGRVGFTVNNNIADKIGKTATIKATIPTQNYEDITYIINITITDKNTAPSAPDCNMTLTYDSTTDTYSAEISAVTGAEYKFNDGVWGAANTLAGIAHGKKVTGYIRIAETENTNASDFNSDTKTAGHGTLTYHEALAATCTTDGVKAHYECGCGKLFADDQAATEVTPQSLKIAAHHSYGTEWVSDNDENHYHICTVCRDKTDITDHSYDGGVITTQPTEETEGVKTYTCEDCKHTKTEPIAKLESTLPLPKVTATPGENSVSLKWTAVSGAKSYRAFYRVNGTKTWTTKNTTGTSVTITGLTGGTKYDFLVLAYDGTNWSKYTNSDIISATPKTAVVTPAKPVFTATAGVNSISLKWNAVSGAASYRVYYRVNGTTAWKYRNTTATAVTLTDLTGGTKYDIAVRAYSGSAWSAFSTRDIVNATPLVAGKKPVFSSVTPGVNRAILRWNAVDGAKSYRVFYRVSGTTKWSYKNTTLTAMNLTGLEGGKTYEFVVRAYNGSTWTAYSSADIVKATIKN